ncbi:MAG: S9 family peptidase [Burkholderiaceae bacterium]|nr:S9 family peptidase [Burkholderiaceae bacterium]
MSLRAPFMLPALLALALLTACQTAPSTSPALDPAAVLAPPAALQVEGVPPIPRAVVQAFQRYADVAGHGFVDWHPTRREMIVTHRPPGASTTQIWRLRGPGQALEPLTQGRDRVVEASWEPAHGRYIVFQRDTGGDEAAQVYRLDPDTRAETQLTTAGERHGIAGWMPRSGQLIVSSVPLDRTAAGGRRDSVSTRFTAIDPLAPVGSPQAQRVLADLPGPGWFGFKVSPDETHAVVTRYFSPTHSELWRIDLAGPRPGERRRLLPAEGDTGRAAHFVSAWSEDGRSVILVSDRAGEFRELMTLDIASGRLTRFTGHIPWDVDEADANAPGAPIALAMNVDGRQELRLVDRATGAERPVPPVPGGSVTALRFHRGSGQLALVVNSPQGPGQVHVLDLATGRHEPWTTPVVPAGLDLGQVPDQQIVRWSSFDGRTISGVLSLPPARFTGRRPVLMVMHGGPASQSKQGWNGRLNYFLLERGIAILEPNVRGSSGYGKTFLDLDNARLREDSVKDMASAIDWVARQPRLDAGKVVVMGGSYGGYMALAAATRLGDRIAGAYSMVGISNFVTFLENTESYRRELRRSEYGDERDPAMRQFLTDISPLSHTDAVTKPLLVAQGRNDPRVPWTESEQMVRRLQARGAPVWYLLAANEGHGFTKRDNADYALATLVMFLEHSVGR